MRGHRAGFLMVFGCVALWLCALPCRAGFLVKDVKGDNVGVHDIDTLTGGVVGTDFQITLSFFTKITDPAVTVFSSGGAPTDLYGFIDLDVDGNAGTGLSFDDLLGQRGFGGVPGLGVDAYVDLNSLFTAPGTLNMIRSDGWTAVASYSYLDDYSLQVTMALSDLGSSDVMAGAAIALDINNGGFVSDTSPDLSTVPVPPAAVLFGIGLFGLAACRWRPSRAQKPPLPATRPEEPSPVA
jgi:hypothetical protein